MTAAHPRSRGENRSSSSRVSVTGGSSPLTRGPPVSAILGEMGGGLIPAHAGKTGAVWLAYAGCAAHPRSRGEN